VITKPGMSGAPMKAVIIAAAFSGAFWALAIFLLTR